MKLSVDWLKEYLELPNWPAEELADKLSLIGHESEVINPELLDLKITPNRGDCLSVYGLARDLAGLYDLKLESVSTRSLPEHSHFFNLALDSSAQSDVLTDQLLLIENYRSIESPSLVKERLKVIGVQPKELMIDLSNYVSYELGLPLHVFDFDQVSSGLKLTRLTEETKVKLLNGQDYHLQPDTLVQISNNQVVDLAGIMGADRSAVKGQTTRVLLQAAVFAAKTVRSSSQNLNLVSEASYRYERGVDRQLASLAVGRFAQLLQEYSPKIELKAYQQLVGPNLTRTSLPLDIAKINSLLGIDNSQIAAAKLPQLGFKLKDNQLEPPSWRSDVLTTADLAEEIARLIGYDQFKSQSLPQANQPDSTEFGRQRALKASLIKLGLTEISSRSLLPGQGKVNITNPSSQREVSLRENLIEGLVEAVSKNIYLGRFGFFEIGHVFCPDELTALGLILVNPLEKVPEIITTKLGLDQKFEQVEPALLSKYDVRQSRIYYLEIVLSKLKIPNTAAFPPQAALPKLKAVSKFPPVVRDVSFLVDRKLDEELLLKKLLAFGEIIIAEKIDQFESDQLGQDKKSITIRLIFQSLERSLTDAEVSQKLAAYFQELSSQVQFQLR